MNPSRYRLSAAAHRTAFMDSGIVFGLLNRFYLARLRNVAVTTATLRYLPLSVTAITLSNMALG